MPRLVELVLETRFSVTYVSCFANIAPIIVKPWSLQVHASPRIVTFKAACINTPYPSKENTFIIINDSEN